jgi:hypothetical protein
MRRLCTEGSCSYSGRAAQRAARAAMGVELRPRLKSLEVPSNPKVSCDRHGSRTAGHDERRGAPTGPYRDPGSALGGNAEV